MDPKEIGAKIKKYRRMRGMTQQELELGISAAFGSISRIESGKTNPTKETLVKIAEVLGMSDEEKIAVFNLSSKHLDILKQINEYVEHYANDYIVTWLKTESFPTYGVEHFTQCNYFETIQAISETSKYYYYHNQESVLIKLLSGFKFLEDFKPMYQYKEWLGTEPEGPLSDLHKVALPISTLPENKSTQLSYSMRTHAHYTELVEGKRSNVSHGWVIKIKRTTLKSEMNVHIPKGKESKIKTMIAHLSVSGFKLQEMQLPVKSGIFAEREIGDFHVEENEDSFKVSWNPTQILYPGYTCNISWFTDQN